MRSRRAFPTEIIQDNPGDITAPIDDWFRHQYQSLVVDFRRAVGGAPARHKRWPLTALPKARLSRSALSQDRVHTWRQEDRLRPSRRFRPMVLGEDLRPRSSPS